MVQHLLLYQQSSSTLVRGSHFNGILTHNKRAASKAAPYNDSSSPNTGFSSANRCKAKKSKHRIILGFCAFYSTYSIAVAASLLAMLSLTISRISSYFSSISSASLIWHLALSRLCPGRWMRKYLSPLRWSARNLTQVLW